MGETKTETLTDYGYGDAFYATTTMSAAVFKDFLTVDGKWDSFLGVKVAVDNDTTASYSVGFGSWSGRNEIHAFNTIAGESTSGKSTVSFSSVTNYDAWPSNHDFKSYFTATELAGMSNVAITLGFAPTNAETTYHGLGLVITVTFNDGSVQNIVGLAGGLKWSNAGAYRDYKATELQYESDYVTTPTVTKVADWSFTDLVNSNYKTLGIPEPTTATLSLLALAGLCVRRRR